ncbi:iron-sulfur cluster repair di-iron protein [Neorhizobium sp. Rsf11]|uniref:Iron-sulfur cluster repair di-iron protein n=2 Tax=Neorhizobium TaxID=1525371 RepID=A0ABV0MAD5_9HYPH|nr:iron-sulfur cluster repair di-iron protein [Neorhizobium petrolearium]MCC2614162.1 iron-sulfur cluster repair di-iron protein [Neorhizobium petrolearium]WGI71674.1 iron-sulfur cluster repair di-iron protein [Neorhizobium petrolearium]
MSGINPDKTVAAFATELPGAAEIFRRHGISFCCGGDIPLSMAAEQAGLAPAALIADLEALEQASGRDAPQETLALIAHILSRYHAAHREELDWLIPLAQKVERVHAAHPSAPIGLSETLTRLRDDLEGHMKREEQVLFPMMQRGGSPMITHPISEMRHEHEDEAQHLQAIEHVTHSLALPEGACRSWTALYTGLRKFTDDLVVHMHLENEVLFPRFETVS